ncbi:hypothetical protein PRZ48_012957 [Zasmidium cellare]|uniref:tripeptidyl-peptidase II n=1 Tax=Zasmidium cellare TaxID=395010 RepID=A0ABR0E2X4_ZASCE|nr:hypothetical protein PRZ48_012957 [Zasmidium cellare]
MKDFTWLAVASLSLLAQAAPTENTRHVLHEKRSTTPRRWQRGERVHPDAILPVKIGLTQKNLEDGHELLMQVSHPDSERYGRHWSAEEVHEFFAPAEEAAEDVKAWLMNSGIDASSIMHYENKGWLALNVSASKAEQMFKTEYFEYEHKGRQSEGVKVGCDDYHLPEHIAKHIDYITPGIALSSNMIKSKVKRDWPHHWGPGHRPPGPHEWKPPHQPWHLPPGAGDLPKELQGCSANVTPTCLRALYGIPKATRKDNINSLGLYESGDTYSQQDLNLFFQHYATNVPQGTHPTLNSVDGGQAPVAPDSVVNTGESDIDMDIAFSLVYPQTVTLYQVDDLNNGEVDGFNNFLDALDGSYCSYTAYGLTGNTAPYDSVYPDPAPGGYKGQVMCGTYKPTRVISVSYGESEYDMPWNYTRRQCNEYMKLGLQGVTIMYASGDYGVGSFPGDDSDSGCLGDAQNVYNPQYPTCPYVLSVGATRLYPNQTVRDKESAMQAYEIGPTFNSAGGFSNYFPVPSYQKSAISTYFSSHDPTNLPYYTAGPQGQNIGVNGGVYNRAGRGLPDVSANGARFVAYNNQSLGHWFGTSLASPEWASVITLINQERTVAGKGSVGFINPTLYENSWAMNDIVNGSNPNCGSTGFQAVEGWDPVTGLGTPNYPKLLQVFSRLP